MQSDDVHPVVIASPEIPISTLMTHLKVRCAIALYNFSIDKKEACGATFSGRVVTL